MGDNRAHDVGIVGPWFTLDYGNILSYYSLYRIIERMGLSPRMVAQPHGMPDDVANNHSRKFIVDAYDVTPRVFPDRFQLFNDWCDTFIVGSCQTWNWDMARFFQRSYWLDFAQDDKRKLAYAASFGDIANRIPESEQPVVQQLMSRFDGISVRDEDSALICEQDFGVSPDVVLDPTFLVNPQHFLDLAQDRCRRSGHMLAYILDPHPEQHELLENLSVYLGMEPLALLGGQIPDPRAAEAVLGLPSAGPETDIQAFIAMIAEAGFVVTDSLAAVNLCIALHKPFVSLLDVAHHDSRFQSVANTFNLTDRFLVDASPEALAEVADTPVDWAAVSDILQPLVGESRTWLASQLGVERAADGSAPRPVEKIIVQNLIFPEGSLEDDWGLCNRGAHMWVDIARERENWLTGEQFWNLPPGHMIECFTYLNSFSIRKWSAWTTATEFVLRIRVQGAGTIIPFGHWRDGAGIGKEFGTNVAFSCEQPTWVTVPVKSFRADVWAFMLEAMGPIRVFDGYYMAITDSPRNQVTLDIVTTTFKNEEFIHRNVDLLSRTYFGQHEPGRNTFMTVVDNGRTLNPAELESSYVEVIPNQNSGGAGGFARGMAEALHDERKPTHVLLMDDDVEVLPEAIFRTHSLLSILRPEFQGRFVSGAMVELRRKFMQLESLAHFDADMISARPEHHMFDLTRWDQILVNEIDLEFPNQYAAWWFCCLPISAIETGQLSFPFFVRGDDVDFSLRHAPGFLRLNGIFVWHEAFAPRYSITMEKYQVIRNYLVVAALHGNADAGKIVAHVRALVKDALIGFSYAEANVILDAVEDFLSGPDFFEQLDGIQAIRGHSVEPGTPLGLEEGDRMRRKGANSYIKLSRLQRYLIRVSRNGQRFPLPSHGRKVAAVGYMYNTDRPRVYGVKEIVITGSDGEKSWLRKRDRSEFFRTNRRFAEVTKKLRDGFAQAARDYRAREEELESEHRLEGRLS